MKKARKSAAILAFLMSMSVFTGCTGSNAVQDGSTTDDNVVVADAAEYDSGTATTESDTLSLSELYGDKTIQLTVFSQLANYSGKMTGWFAKIMKDKYNCEITIIPATDGTFDTRMESGDLGDIVVFGSDGDDYKRAIEQDMLFDWNEDDILTDYGSYIKENMTHAMEKNASLTNAVNGQDTVYGIANNIATSANDHESFFYTWDLRWDLYKELGYPEVKNIDDYFNLMVKMKEICPTDEFGNPTYAVSLWPDWDGSIVMYVNSFCTAYWGYDGLPFGLYDISTGEYHYAADKDSPYIDSLKFFNRLNQAGLIDPNSMTQTYNEMSEKVMNGGTFFSIFDYAGSKLYNTEEHMAENKMMLAFTPEDATPCCYGMNVNGNSRIWTIGKKTEYPELCMSIINYLTTPEGYMTYWYGPKDLCWYYDDDGYSCLTELGESCYNDPETKMPEEWGSGNFRDGKFPANNNTWSLDASNPDSNDETYNAKNWISRQAAAKCDIEKDWRDFTGCINSEEYLNNTNYKVVVGGTTYSESPRSDDLKIIWQQLSTCIVNYSWRAIYAESDDEFNSIIDEMIAKSKEYDPDGQVVAWCENEAKIRFELEQKVK